MSGAPPEADDAFVRVVRITVGRRQVDALTGDAGRRGKRAALEQAVMTSAWSSARPGDRASDWVRVVHPIDPPLEALAPDRQLLLLVAGLRRSVAQAAGGDDDQAKSRLALARETFGEPAREQIGMLLARAAAHSDD
ncbi:MAG TPA: hypothetical protein VFG74_02650 [Miltoncostaeaceae bacterium]|jgi:hypothetical protein|nr:hypothetical protein [Miltoncostaeaceae bacterium]